MILINDIHTVSESFPNVVLTIGSFDGIHLGHRRIIEEVVREAQSVQGTACLMSLKPHPREFFAPGNPPNILLSDAKKEALLAEAGIDVLFILPFNQEAASMLPDTFLREIVVGRCHAKHVIVGHDFCFGKNAQGDYEYLKEAAPGLGFEVRQIPQRVIKGERVSSTLIREYILQGEVDKVEVFLGRKYSIAGEIIPGRGVGITLGYPTANIAPHHNAVPAHGVYVAEAVLEGKPYPAAVNIGVAPTIRNEDIAIEAFLLDFTGNIVGQPIELIFHKRLRPEKKFASREELVDAITHDVATVRHYFTLQIP
ncbi:MAG TPA: bifunctional riboflavin kinase/FAD synthetase [Candidatus Hydrogenedentes bacterium]|nr:bifunctional riboflavin kinase/FAD synthetase [Candidatus Hydrogenedentota bacterium]